MMSVELNKSSNIIDHTYSNSIDPSELKNNIRKLKQVDKLICAGENKNELEHDEQSNFESSWCGRVGAELLVGCD